MKQNAISGTGAQPLQIRKQKLFVLCYVIGYLIVIAFAASYSLRGGTNIEPLKSTTAFVILSVAISFVLVLFVFGASKNLNDFKSTIFSLTLPVGILSLALTDVYRDANWFKNYGDVYFMKDWINANIPFSRWLLGTALLIDVFEFINNVVFSISAPMFITSASAICMAFSTFVVLRSFGNKPFVILPITTPIWILFSTGYDEYYPFIAGVFLAVALWVSMDQKTSRVNFFFVIAGVLPAIYTGFVLLAGFVLLKLLTEIKKTKDFFIGLSLSATAFLLAVEISWPAGHSNYLGRLYNDFGGGDTRSVHNYQGSSMSESLPFYSLRSAFSGFHMRDVLFSMFFAGGVAAIGLVLLLLWKCGKRFSNAGFKELFARRVFSLPIVFLFWNVFYLVFVQAKLGPAMDIDLQFGQNLVLAIWCGFMLEKIFDEYALDARARSIALSAIVSLNGPIVAALLIYGIQR